MGYRYQDILSRLVVSLLIRTSFVVFLFVLTGASPLLGAALWSDHFEDRAVLTSDEGTLPGNNLSATRDPGEASAGNLATGKTLWISWIPSGNGLATLTTDGSSIATLLRVYTLEREHGVEPPELESVIDSDDDSPSTGSSSAQFAARKGVRYEIMIDGYAGAAGDLQLQWKLVSSDSLLPLVARKSGDRSLQVGNPLILTVDIQSTDRLELRWLHNEIPVPDADTPTLLIRRFQPSDVGQYRLLFKVDDLSFKSAPIEIQINSEGLVFALARNRLLDCVHSGLSKPTPPPPGPSLADATGGFSRGYDGSQIFNTLYASRDPAEPLHCGVTGGASYWFAYQPPVSGRLMVNTEGSAFDTVIAIYSYDPPLTSYAGLVSVGCDNNSGADGITSRVEVDVDFSKSYLIVLDGVAGARGLAHLNYVLTPTTAVSPQPPVFVTVPDSQVLAAGANVVLESLAQGTPPLSYQWFLEGSPLSDQTNTVLTLVNVKLTDAGSYRVVVSNQLGSVSTPVTRVSVINSPLLSVSPTANHLVMGFPASAGFQYRVETATTTESNAWQLAYVALTDPGGVVWWTNALDQDQAKFFRIRKP